MSEVMDFDATFLGDKRRPTGSAGAVTLLTSSRLTNVDKLTVSEPERDSNVLVISDHSSSSTDASVAAELSHEMFGAYCVGARECSRCKR